MQQGIIEYPNDAIMSLNVSVILKQLSLWKSVLRVEQSGQRSEKTSYKPIWVNYFMRVQIWLNIFRET